MGVFIPLIDSWLWQNSITQELWGNLILILVSALKDFCLTRVYFQQQGWRAAFFQLQSCSVEQQMRHFVFRLLTFPSYLGKFLIQFSFCFPSQMSFKARRSSVFQQAEAGRNYLDKEGISDALILGWASSLAAAWDLNFHGISWVRKGPQGSLNLAKDNSKDQPKKPQESP